VEGACVRPTCDLWLCMFKKRSKYSPKNGWIITNLICKHVTCHISHVAVFVEVMWRTHVCVQHVTCGCVCSKSGQNRNKFITHQGMDGLI
jgi:hypothetical protein